MRGGNTARVTRNTPPTDQGNTPILMTISQLESMVVRSLSISTVASAGILTADSFGVILFKKRKITRVIAVKAAEQAKNNPAAIFEDDEPPIVIIEAMGGNIPEKPWPVMIA